MLVLSRKENQRIIVAGQITITVVEIRRNQVRLGITAPADVPVYREEVWVEMQAEDGPAAPNADGGEEFIAEGGEKD